jgi:hypothetical protein
MSKFKKQVAIVLNNNIQNLENEVNAKLTQLKEYTIFSVTHSSAPSTNPGDGMWYSVVITYEILIK